MKLLGHTSPEMTMRYVEVASNDLQREFHLARQSPRYLIPLPVSLTHPDPDCADPPAILERLSASIRLLDLFRQQTSADSDKLIRLLLRRLARVRSLFEKLVSDTNSEK